MLPTVVVGIGGTGKWVILDLKKRLREKLGAVPPEVALFVLDVAEEEDPQVKRESVSPTTGQIETLEIQYHDPGEFYNFSAEWEEVAKAIRNGNASHFPYIAEWLQKEDAESYAQITNKTTKEGAGQLRQASRTSLFLHATEMYQSFRKLFMRIERYLGAHQPRVIIVSSLAGGTGCGTLIDVANLLRHAQRSVIERVDALFYGILLLPKGFEANDPNSMERMLMGGNCYAAWREQHRLMLHPESAVSYSDELKDIKPRVRPFNFCFLIDGKQVGSKPGSGAIKPWMGVDPAIAEFILLRLQEETAGTTHEPQIVGQLDTEWQKNRNDAAGYSTFGVHRAVFDCTDMVRSFAWNASLATVNHLLEQCSPEWGGGAVQNFMKDARNTPLNRQIYALLEQQISLNLANAPFLGLLRLESGEDVEPPSLDLSKVETSTLGHPIPFKALKGKAQKLRAAAIGSEDDLTGPRSPVRTIYGVLNYYQQKHLEKFLRFLEIHAAGIMNERVQPLRRTARFLEKLTSVYARILAISEKHFSTESASLEERLKTIEQEQARDEKMNYQKKYLQHTTDYLKIKEQQLFIATVQAILTGYQQAVATVSAQVKRWTNRLDAGRTALEDAAGSQVAYRKGQRDVQVHTYVTEPDDEWERSIYDLLFGRTTPKNDKESAIKNRLPALDLNDLSEGFSWNFPAPETLIRDLAGFVPSGFPGWALLETDVLRWQSQFAAAITKTCRLSALDNLSIMDLLALKGAQPSDFLKDLAEKADFMAAISAVAQAAHAGSGRQLYVGETGSVFAFLKPIGEPGASFAQDLQAGCPQAIEVKDTCSIVQVRIQHSLKKGAFSNLQDQEANYRENVSERYPFPVHVFPEEAHAAILFEPLLQKVDPTVQTLALHPDVVALLKNTKDIRNFSYAYRYGWFHYERSGDQAADYRLEVENLARQQTIVLGSTLLEAMQTAIAHPMVCEKLNQEMKILFSSKLVDGSEFIKELQDHYHALKPEEMASSVEKDLVRAMKIVFLQDIERLEEEAKRAAAAFA
ncbi:MAG: tubulin-like doman-containing protein [bacterium]